jgi:hypothetical protein
VILTLIYYLTQYKKVLTFQHAINIKIKDNLDFWYKVLEICLFYSYNSSQFIPATFQVSLAPVLEQVMQLMSKMHIY